MRSKVSQYAIFVAAWIPFFIIWVLFMLSYSRDSITAVLASAAVSIGSASLLGTGVWAFTKHFSWPVRLDMRFYTRHLLAAGIYAWLWILPLYVWNAVRQNRSLTQEFLASRVLGWQILTGFWLYGLVAGISYAIQIRQRLHEKERLAEQAGRLATSARLDALRARLHPHFLFNALHTVSGLIQFNPPAAQEAVERLGDMLRYTLKEDGRQLVEFSEEAQFTRQYVAFEQLRYGERLQVEFCVAPECEECDILPFGMQTLVENAVRHSVATRPEGGRIWVSAYLDHPLFTIRVKDDGPGSAVNQIGNSHQSGLRSLRDRLSAAYGGHAVLIAGKAEDGGFEVRMSMPLNREAMVSAGTATQKR